MSSSRGGGNSFPSSWTAGSSPFGQSGARGVNVINQFANGRVVSVGELLAQTNPNTINNTATNTGPSQGTTAGENSLLQVIYGRRRVGAKIAAVVVYNGNLILLCVWGLGEINQVESVQINDAAVPTGVTMTHYTGTQSQVKDSTLVTAYAAQTPAQTYNDDLKGIAYSVISISSSAAITGFPRISAVIQGQKVEQADQAYVSLNGTTQYFSAPDSTLTDINEDFEIEACVSLNDWTPAGDQPIVTKWDNTVSNQRCYWFGVVNGSTGLLRLLISTTGANTIIYNSSVAPSFTDGTRYWVKVSYVKNNGTNSTATFYTSTDGIAYTQLGSVVTGSTVASMFNGTAQTRIGSDYQPTFLAGKIWYARLDTATKRVIDFIPWNQSASLSTWVDDNGNTWTGQSSAVINSAMLGYSRVPVYALCDLIQNNTYGLGKRTDLRSVLQVWAWNTEIVTDGAVSEARHFIDLALDTDQPVETWLNVLRDYAHCWVVPEGGTYYLIRDANDAVEGSFDTTTIMQNSMQIKKRGARNQPTVVEITWTDTSQSPWRDQRETVYFPGVLGGTVPRRMSRISKPGITRRSEAYRYAVERLNESTLSDVSIDFAVDDSAATVRVGGIYNITHPIGFTAKPFRVLKVRPMFGRYQISANEFDPALYSSSIVTQPTIVDSTLPNPNAPPTLTGLNSTEDVVQTKDGLYVSRIRVDWTDPSNFPLAFIRSYRVQIYDNSVPQVLVHQSDVSSRPFVTPPLKELVPYTCKVSIVSSTGVVGTAAITTITPQGKYLPPSDVSSVSGFEAGGRVYLSWAAAIDLTLDTIRYEIRYGSTSSTWDTATRVDRVSALTYASPGFPTGTYRFFVKALDSVGNYSANAAYVDVTVSVDSAAFSAYTYMNQSVESLAMTENVIAGNRIATTDWGDNMGYGHATGLNTTGLWDDGTVPGTTVATQPHTQSMRFSYTDNRYVTVPYVAAHNVGATFTVEAWVYPVAHDASTGRAIFSQRTNNDAGGWDLRLRDGCLRLNGTAIVAESVEKCPLFQWSHVCAKVSAGAAQLYINGKEVTYGSGPNAYTFLNNTNQRWIGALRTGAVFAFDGFIKRTKLWNAALSDANRLISMQYGGDPTSIGGLVGCWNGVDQGEGSTSTTYADVGSGASNGTITPSADWRSWSYTLAQAIDLGQVINGTFTVSGGDVTSLNGAVGPVIQLSNDGTAYTTYKQPTVVGSARFFKFGYESQGGSMSVNLTNMRGDVLVTPRTEIAQATCITTAGVPGATVYLSGLYAKVIDLQATPAGTPNAWFAVPDQIEVAPQGVAGGSACIKWQGSTGSYASGTYTITLGNAVSIEGWAYLSSHDGTNGEVLWNLVTNSWAAVNFYVASDLRCVSNGGWGSDVFVNGTAAVYFPVGRWVHVAVVYDQAANNAKLYFNGVLVGTTTYRDLTNTASRTWSLGYSPDATTYGWAGYQYGFRVWNEARTAQNILDNYKSHLGATTNLVLSLKCQEKSGTTLADSSGNARDFTIAGTQYTNWWWRPINGFDVYLFDAAAARQAGDVRCRWQGA